MNLTPPPDHYLVRMPHSYTGHRYINRSTANCKSTANRSVGDCSRSSTHAQTHGPSEIIIPPASSIGWAHRRRNGGRQRGSGNCLPHFSIWRGNQCKLPRHFNADFTKISSHLTEQLSSRFQSSYIASASGSFPPDPATELHPWTPRGSCVPQAPDFAPPFPHSVTCGWAKT